MLIVLCLSLTLLGIVTLIEPHLIFFIGYNLFLYGTLSFAFIIGFLGWLLFQE